MLSEVRNIATVIPDWHQRDDGRILHTGPGPGGADMHLQAGLAPPAQGAVWLPTATEQSAVYNEWAAATYPARRRATGEITPAAV